jgi:hypothetical protein
MQRLPKFKPIPPAARNPDGSVNGSALLPFSLETLELGGQCRLRLHKLQDATYTLQGVDPPREDER